MNTAIEDVKARADLVEIIGRSIQLKKVGSSYKGLCPFHQEKTPSFTVRPATQSWHCFGCSKHGDVFDWLERHDSLEFVDALKVLAHEVGVNLPEHGDTSASDQKRRLYAALESASVVYRDQLNNGNWARAKEYLDERDIDIATAQDFGLGYAPRGHWLIRALLETGSYTRDDLYDAGLIVKTPFGESHDFLRDRIVFPIHDKQGRTIALGGRALAHNNTNTPKYLNTCETPIFHKQDVLYGLDLAQHHIARERRAVLVEGYFDVISAYAHGFQNVVATLGTAVSASHLRQLKNQTDEIVLAMDPDAAGVTATWRTLQIAAESLRGGTTPVLGPNRHHQSYVPGRPAELKVMILPGKDPDQVIRSSPKVWSLLVTQALPVVDFVLHQVQARHDLTSAQGKAAAAGEVADVLAGVANPVERSHYVQQAADLLEVDAIDIRQLLHAEPVSRIVDYDAKPPVFLDSDVEWDAYALALERHAAVLSPAKPVEFPLASSQGRAYARFRFQHPELESPEELADFRQRVMERYDSLSLSTPEWIRISLTSAAATLQRRAALRERASLLTALRDAESDDERNQLALALNEWRGKFSRDN